MERTLNDFRDETSYLHFVSSIFICICNKWALSLDSDAQMRGKELETVYFQVDYTFPPFLRVKFGQLLDWRILVP
jgi:hypothetical protein